MLLIFGIWNFEVLVLIYCCGNDYAFMQSYGLLLSLKVKTGAGPVHVWCLTESCSVVARFLLITVICTF